MAKKFFSRWMLYLLGVLLVSGALFTPSPSFAGLLNENLKRPLQEQTSGFGLSSGYDTTKNDPITLAATVIRAFLGLLGVIFLVLLVYAGYRWMNAQGEEEEVTKAKKIIAQAVIGLIIVLSAYAISYFVTFKLEQATLRQVTGVP